MWSFCVVGAFCQLFTRGASSVLRAAACSLRRVCCFLSCVGSAGLANQFLCFAQPVVRHRVVVGVWVKAPLQAVLLGAVGIETAPSMVMQEVAASERCAARALVE